MKVDGQHIFNINQHKGILVEKILTGLKIPEKVPVYQDFDYEKLIGIATLRKNGLKIYADFALFIDIKGYPAIAYRQFDMQIYAISIGSVPNVDKDITAIV